MAEGKRAYGVVFEDTGTRYKTMWACDWRLEDLHNTDGVDGVLVVPAGSPITMCARCGLLFKRGADSGGECPTCVANPIENQCMTPGCYNEVSPNSQICKQECIPMQRQVAYTSFK